MRLRTAYFLFCFMVLFFAFSLSAEDKGEVEAGTPVMEPGLNAYIMEKGEELFKIEMDTGFRRSTFKFASVNLSKNYFATALNAYINSKGIFDAGLALDLGLAGKDNHYFGLGPRFRLLLNRIPFFEPLYIKWGAMYGSFSNSSTVFGDLVYLKSKGLVISYGGGFHVATGRYSVV
ncbi:MAG: hypothetical protein JXA66_06950, partial [Oligoflexia bacterium]|nr:hypothetical protein [Oligoflexia bacterium]